MGGTIDADESRNAQTTIDATVPGTTRVDIVIGEEDTIDNQTHPIHFTVESLWGSATLTLAFVVLLGPGNSVTIEQLILREVSALISRGLL